MDQVVLQVSDLLTLANQTLEYAYPSVTVEGEVASFKVSKGKYVFFDLKDSESLVNCFMMVYGLKHQLEDGMHVQIVAQPRLTSWGKFSLTVREIRPIGEGSIKRALQLLRQKLQKEGLFDESRKRPLPYLPQSIGLVASTESAGYADFIKILNQRWSGTHVMVKDVQVQGDIAAGQIIDALNYFNQKSEPPEVLVVIRGGGSAEDLSAFNEESLVHCIALSRVPTVVGVGHEIDVTLADLAADVRASTPSNAAQILFPDKAQFISEINYKQHYLLTCVQGKIDNLKLSAEHASERMIKSMQLCLDNYYQRVFRSELLLKQLNPEVVLRRGYSIARSESSKIIKEPEDVGVGDKIVIEGFKFVIEAGVTDVREK